MNLYQLKLFNYYSLYDDSIYNHIAERGLLVASRGHFSEKGFVSVASRAV